MKLSTTYCAHSTTRPFAVETFRSNRICSAPYRLGLMSILAGTTSTVFCHQSPLGKARITFSTSKRAAAMAMATMLGTPSPNSATAKFLDHFGSKSRLET
jgi:hypothetical protein